MEQGKGKEMLGWEREKGMQECDLRLSAARGQLDLDVLGTLEHGSCLTAASI